jgi:lysophospholipase L1-like esterase/poly(3-hydroxybutyrate) depolymerase
LCVLLLLPLSAPAQTPAPLPKVVLVGDSIRLGYEPLVARRLEGRAVVVRIADNGGDSGNVLAHLDEWVLPHKRDLVHLNCGLHDLKQDRKSKHYQVDLAAYEKNLKAIVDRLRKETGAAIVFATTTPIDDERHARRKAAFDRREEDVRRYNRAVLDVMGRAGVVVHDLHAVVDQGGAQTLLGPDGTHYTDAGNERLAEAVAECVLRQLTVRAAHPQPAPPRSPDAVAAYRKAEAARDALVPRAYKEMKFGAFELPADAAAWEKRRPEVLRTVVQSLGDLPPRPAPQRVRLVSREVRDGYTLEQVAIANGVEGETSALLLVPQKRAARAPAVLWLHSSTPDKTQIITPHTNGGAEPLGEVLVRAGYVVLAPDAYWHGGRVGTGPSGTAEKGFQEQEDLFKLNQWLGRTLWGMFVRDDQIALEYLCGRPEVDPRRIGVTGMSMGSTRAWWLAAVDDRVAAAAGVACLTRYQNLIAHGGLRQHGVYYYVHGLLRHFDSEGVLSLIAPRPFLAVTGELDAGSPADGIKVIEDRVSGVYAAVGAKERFRSVRYAEVGHTYTPEMRAEVLAWFARWLKPEAP